MEFEYTIFNAHEGYVNERLSEYYRDGWEVAGEAHVKYHGSPTSSAFIYIPMKRKRRRPPLGVTPMWTHNEQRLEELNKAIDRYDRANLPVPKEWIAEKQSLDAYCQGRLKDE